MNPQTWEDTGKPVTFVDVYEEFGTQVTEKYKILKFKSKVLISYEKTHLNNNELTVTINKHRFYTEVAAQYFSIA